MSKFTKGEWTVKYRNEMASVYYPHGFLTAANVIRVDESRNNGESWLDMRTRTQEARDAAAVESNANIHLIATAPEMYEMLEQISGFKKMIDDGINVHGGMSGLHGSIDMIDQLLAKARGEHE